MTFHASVFRNKHAARSEYGWVTQMQWLFTNSSNTS